MQPSACAKEIECTNNPMSSVTHGLVWSVLLHELKLQRHIASISQVFLTVRGWCSLPDSQSQPFKLIPCMPLGVFCCMASSSQLLAVFWPLKASTSPQQANFAKPYEGQGEPVMLPQDHP